jgi:hypothetical protein
VPSGYASPSGQHVPSGHASVLPSGHATPSGSNFDAYRLVQETEMEVLQNGQAPANISIQQLMEDSARFNQQLSNSHGNMTRQMSDQKERLLLHMDARMSTFAQGVEGPVQNAVQASTTPTSLATELAGQYRGM